MAAPCILALDPAAVTGWCLGVAGEQPEYGHVRLAPPGSSIGRELAELRKFVETKLATEPVTAICFEAPYVPVPRKPRFGKAGNAVVQGAGPPPMNALTVRRLSALAGVIEMVAWEYGILCREVTTQQASAYFTGHGRWGGRAQKKAAVVAMAKRFGWAVENDNDADALAIFCFAESVLAPTVRRSAGPAASMMI